MQLILLKATNVKHPGSRGGQFWIDEKGHARYDEKPTGEKRPHKYLALIRLSDGSEKYILPNDNELDANGQVIGGQPKIREIINRELFGEHGFKTDGTFWQKKGILIEYKTRVTARGKIEVDPIERHEGYTSFEFRDSSVSRAYGGGEDEEPNLPKKITQYRVAEKPHSAVPSKEKIELPEGATSDQPPIEELSIHTVPPRKPQTEVAIGEKLTDREDPVEIASAFLSATFGARKPSQAMTEAGQEKARKEREGQFAGIEGKRKINRLPVWAFAKFDSPAHLQQELSRGEGGRPLTTLITLGLWDPENKSKRFREQLLKEWAPFLRRWSQRFAGVYASTDSYRKFDKIDGGDKASRVWMHDRQRDLYNEGVMVLLDEANRYMSNDEPKGADSRFDLAVTNAIKNHLEQKAKRAAIEAHGATFEELKEEDKYNVPTMLSPREQFELRNYEHDAVRILGELTSTLKPAQRAAFMARLWVDDYDKHPDASEERIWNERRASREDKHGKSNLHWGRPWIRSGETDSVDAVSDKLADTEVKLRGGKGTTKLGTLLPQHQMYYLEKWFGEAQEHVLNRLRNKNGMLTPDGVIVERWLRLEEKLARVNTKEVEERTQHKLVSMPTTVDRPPLVEHNRAHENPAITFFRQPGTNRQLAERLGIADDLDMPISLKNMNLPKPHAAKLKRIEDYHRRLQANLKYVGDLSALRNQTHIETERLRNQGSWYRSPSGSMEWHESGGVVALHEAAVKLHKTKGEDKEALSTYTIAANALGAEHPMVQDYTRRLGTLGADVPTSADLAAWKARSHSSYREHANRLHLIEFAQEQRTAKKSVTDLRDAFAKCIQAFEGLRKAFA